MSGRHGGGGSPRGNRTALVVMLTALAPVVLGSLVGLVLLWPSGDGGASPGVVQLASDGQVRGEVLGSTTDVCEGSPDDRLPDGSLPLSSLCGEARVALLTGPDAGAEVVVPLPPQVVRAGMEPGRGVVLDRYALDTPDPGLEAAGGAVGLNVYAYVDFDRSQALVVLAAAFALLVVAVGRLQGLAALAGLGLTYLAIAYVVLPALQQGTNAVAVTVCVSVLLMVVVLYLAHGLSTRTTTALVGTLFGLLTTTGLSIWASSAASLTGLVDEDAYVLSSLTGGADLRGIVLCGLVVAGLGILNDVTITQVSAVWEIKAAAPRSSFAELFAGGMRVGRDHLASTVYTIAFAYAGAALPTLLLLRLYSRPLEQVLTSGAVAEEIARTAIGSIGLILAMPVTTAVAAISVARAERSDAPEAAGPTEAPVGEA